MPRHDRPRGGGGHHQRSSPQRGRASHGDGGGTGADGRTSVERYHDRVASKYDAIYAGSAWWDFHDAVTWDHLRPHLPRDLAVPVADLGCGTGKWGLRIARSGYAVTLVDISARMLDQAREAAEASLPESKRPAYHKADIADLSGLPEGRFGLAVAMGDPLSHCSNPQRAVREIRRILRPGGVLVASADNRAAALRHYLEGGDLDGLEDFVRGGRTHWLTESADERFPVTTFFAGQLRAMLERAGFEVVDLIGKTVLDLRKHARLLEDPATVRRLMRIEARLCREPSCLGLAGHLQVVARRGAGDAPADGDPEGADRGPGGPADDVAAADGGRASDGEAAVDGGAGPA